VGWRGALYGPFPGFSKSLFIDRSDYQEKAGSPGSCRCFWMFMEHQNYPINQKDKWIYKWYSMSVHG
jgi:hypothetical protein